MQNNNDDEGENIVKEFIESFFPTLNLFPPPNQIITNIKDLTMSKDENVTTNNCAMRNASLVHSTTPHQRRMTKNRILEPTTITPHHNDVLCGRGLYRIHSHHPGNVQYQKLVDQKARLYLMARLKSEKQQIISMILNEIRKLDPPGRFLLIEDEDSNLWRDIGDKKAQYKICQSLRGKSSTGRQGGGGVNKSQMKQAPVAVTIAAERHPVAELADHRSQETKSALRLAKGCARNFIPLGAELSNLTDKDDINAQRKHIDTDSALRLAEGYTSAIRSLRAELADLTNEDEINAQKKRIAILNKKRDEALEKA